MYDNIEVKKRNGDNPKIKSMVTGDVLRFKLKKEDLDDPDVFENFIKAVEKMVRKDPRYKNYKQYLMENGLNKCSVFSLIDPDAVSLEMHHGPMFNLYELASILTDALLTEGEKITTFSVADILLKEHEKHHIQLVMLSKTPHQASHDGAIFVHMKQSIGDIMKFIKKYKKGIRREHIYTMEKYLKLCEENEATDNDLFSIVKKVHKELDKNSK